MIAVVDCHIMQWFVTQQKITNIGTYGDNASRTCETELQSRELKTNELANDPA